MPEKIDLAETIDRRLSGEMSGFLQLAGKMARETGQNLYLVGGVVRDLLLERPNYDLDLVLEGDAIGLARRLAAAGYGKVTAHHRFGTASLSWAGWGVDLAMARRETYDRPGALPSVAPGTIRDDLFRRDFTVNAMAIELGAGPYGRLLDLYGGEKDLREKQLRVLHEKSFIDDATRIWRALRYEQRLDFRLEPATRRWLKRDLPYLDTISGDRIRNELELALREEEPEKCLRRAGELGVLSWLHPTLPSGDWLAEVFTRARQCTGAGTDLPRLYLSLLVYPLTRQQVDRFIAYLRPRKLTAQALRDTIDLKSRLDRLAEVDLPGSRIYSLLRGFSTTAITANRLAVDSAVISRRLDLYLGKLRSVKPALGGEDLKKMGIASGPAIKEILSRLLEARLDGQVTTRRQEEEMVRNSARYRETLRR